KVIEVGGPVLDGRSFAHCALSLLDDLDRELGAVGLGEIGLFFQFRGNRAVIDLAGVAILVELEQLRSDRLATIVPLAFVPVDANFQRCGVAHCHFLPRSHVGHRRPVWRMPTAGARTPSPSFAVALCPASRKVPVQAAAGLRPPYYSRSRAIC